MVNGRGWNQPRRCGRVLEGRGEMVAMDGGKEEQRPDAPVEIGAIAPVGLEGCRFRQEQRSACAPAGFVD